MKLEKAPDTIYKYKEIAVHYQRGIEEHFNNLSLEEQIFAYYMYRASLIGNKIAVNQNYKTGTTVIKIFENLYNSQDVLKTLESKISFSLQEFIEQLKIFLVYLWSNHGQYFAKEFSNEKRTPKKLNLNLLTHNNLKEALGLINGELDSSILDQEDIYKSLFDDNYQATLTVPNSIDKSNINFYSQDFTDELYHTVPADIRSKINISFYSEKNGSKLEPKWEIWSQNHRYNKEITVAIKWLEKAKEHAKNNTKYFDKYTPESLGHLIKFLKTGDEQYFKNYFIAWLKTNSDKSRNKIDYSFGFIETYKDPKSHRGSFQAEVTIKTISIETLNQVLPDLEKQLPLDPKYQRDSIDQIPNASINTQLIGTGDLGPMKITAAYCLPNYEDIRCDHGSKQIIYQAEPSLGSLLNPKLNNILRYTQDQAEWLNKHDKDDAFLNDLWNIHCILHETTGHASGKLGYHEFKSGDKIKVTHNNIKELLLGHEQSLEELRAEIIALYISIEHTDTLIEKDLIKGWAKDLNKIELQKWMILEMAYTGLRRLLFQEDNSLEIYGDHARANYTIMNYLIDNGGLSLVIQEKLINNNLYKVPGLEVKDFNLAKQLVKELLIKVQEIKSTGDGQEADKLFHAYGIPLKHPEVMLYLKQNNQVLLGEIKASVYIYPKLEAIYNQNTKDIENIKATWPKDIFEQFNYWNQIAYSTK